MLNIHKKEGNRISFSELRKNSEFYGFHGVTVVSPVILNF